MHILTPLLTTSQYVCLYLFFIVKLGPYCIVLYAVFFTPVIPCSESKGMSLLSDVLPEELHTKLPSHK